MRVFLSLVATTFGIVVNIASWIVVNYIVHHNSSDAGAYFFGGLCLSVVTFIAFLIWANNVVNVEANNVRR